MSLHHDDIDYLAIAIAKALQQSRSVSDSEHYDHHRWIASQIQAEQARKKFWEDMRSHVTRWGLIGALTGLCTACYLALEAWVRHTK